jgi:hypothetical protein
MDKIENQFNVDNLSIEDYQKLVENLRIRINVLNASIFLLEDKLDIIDLDTVNYLGKINSELENIRKMILPYPIKIQNNN